MYGCYFWVVLIGTSTSKWIPENQHEVCQEVILYKRMVVPVPRGVQYYNYTDSKRKLHFSLGRSGFEELSAFSINVVGNVKAERCCEGNRHPSRKK